jgi:hypothetical protein
LYGRPIPKTRAPTRETLPECYALFNAETLQEIWNSEQRPKRDRLGTLMKFVPPLVVGGKVYVPNYDDAVNVYGLLSP